MDRGGGGRGFNNLGSGRGSSNLQRFQDLSGRNLPSPRRPGPNRWRFRGRFRPYSYGQGRGRGSSPNSTTPTRDNSPNQSPSSSWSRPNQNSYYSSSGAGSYPPREYHQPTVDEQYLNQLRKKYPGYVLYFSNSLPTLVNPWDKLELVSQYFERTEGLSSSSRKVKQIEEQEYFDVLHDSITQDLIFMELWTNFADDLLEKPDEVLSLFGLAVHRIVYNALVAEEIENSQHDFPGSSDPNSNPNASSSKSAFIPTLPRIQVRLMKTEPLTPLRSIKSSLLGKLITIRGAVVRIGNVRPYCTHMTYTCLDCCGTFALKLPDGFYVSPSRCGASSDCQGKMFEAAESSSTTKVVDVRKIRVQDIQCGEDERGSVPRTIDCNLYNGMVELCSAGDAVTMCGIVKMSRESGSFSSSDKSLHNCYLEVVALRNHKDSERTMGGNWFSFTNKDFYAVQEMFDTENLFRLLVASLCPTIYGHDLVKAGLILSLFGGTPSSADQVISRRSEINVLIVGDPGLGKSQILNVVSEVAPRGVYVCGTSSSVAGLTVTMVKDGDEYSLEAGALVMADRGVCCIDEFDKMQQQHHALLEAMEQQSISVAKSGVFRTLAARTAVIAAANPAGGHYDKTKTVAENIRISPALLSRFDITFILLDTPDKERDRNIVHHVMGLKSTTSTQRSTSSSLNGSIRRRKDIPLVEQLKFDPDEEPDLIPHHLIRKYIAYAKLYVKPVLNAEAAAVIKEYYLRLRTKHRLIDSTPVTTRQLESLVRLCEARAKVNLREVATAEDASDALEIFEFGLIGVFDNDVVVSSVLSQISLSTSMASTPSSRPQTKSQAKKLVSNLQRLSEQSCKNIFTVDEIKQVGRALGMSSGMESIISALNNEGLLLHKGGRVYQLQSADF